VRIAGGILKSERMRVRALMGLFGVLFVGTLALAFVVPLSWNPFHRLIGERLPLGRTAILYTLPRTVCTTSSCPKASPSFRLPDGAQRSVAARRRGHRFDQRPPRRGVPFR
jgi:hypothetical protein